MSNIGHGLRVLVKDGVAVISGVNSTTKITFLGASCPASVKPGTPELSSVTLSPMKGINAVVALTTVYNPGAKMSNVYDDGLIQLIWKDDGILWVEKDQDFVSSPNRLGQIIADSKDVVVTTAGQVFSTCYDNWGGHSEQYLNNKKEDLKKRGVRIVADANLLCRYLVGQATRQELEAVASDDLRTAETIKFDNALSDLCSLRAEFSSLLDKSFKQGIKSRLDGETLNDQRLLIEKLSSQVGLVEQERDALQKKLNRTIGNRIKNCFTSIFGEKKPGCSRRGYVE